MSARMQQQQLRRSNRRNSNELLRECSKTKKKIIYIFWCFAFARGSGMDLLNEKALQVYLGKKRYR